MASITGVLMLGSDGVKIPLPRVSPKTANDQFDPGSTLLPVAGSVPAVGADGESKFPLRTDVAINPRHIAAIINFFLLMS